MTCCKHGVSWLHVSDCALATVSGFLDYTLSILCIMYTAMTSGLQQHSHSSIALVHIQKLLRPYTEERVVPRCIVEPLDLLDNNYAHATAERHISCERWAYYKFMRATSAARPVKIRSYISGCNRWAADTRGYVGLRAAGLTEYVSTACNPSVAEWRAIFKTTSDFSFGISVICQYCRSACMRKTASQLYEYLGEWNAYLVRSFSHRKLLYDS